MKALFALLTPITCEFAAKRVGKKHLSKTQYSAVPSISKRIRGGWDWIAARHHSGNPFLSRQHSRDTHYDGIVLKCR
jgi:hypothetical protein